MIPERNNQRSVVSTVTGEKIAMSIDQAAMAHIMNVLTDLYSDPEQAVIREYSTNARDAHIEAGNKNPILVTTPSPLSPFLTIQDFGVGLSPDDIEAIYSRYGASTKRASNDVVGMLGLGCKSALTYAEQFTLVGVKDGIRQQVLIARDADGAGSMTVVSTEQTNEPNGVIIKVPAKQGNQFGSKADQFFKYWPKGSVLIDGKPPVELGGQKVTDTLYLISNTRDRWSDRAQDVVVMGGVPYPADLDPNNRLNNNASFVAYVPIGAVEFTPSREALQMTPKTTQAIQKLVSEVHAHLDAAIIKDVDTQPTKADALKAMNAWNRAIRGGQQSRHFTYKGKPIPEGYTIPMPQQGSVAPVEPIHTLRVNTNTLSSSMTQRSIAIAAYPECVFVVNYSGKWTAPRRKKLDKFIAELSNPPTGHTNYVLIPGKPDFDGWVDSSRIFEWADVNAVKLDRQYTTVSGVPARLTGSYDLIDETGCKDQVLAKDVRTTEPLYFLRANGYRAQWYTKYLRATHDKYTLVYMPKNRIEKFKRDFPTAIELTQHLRDEAKTWKDKLTKTEQAAIAQLDMGYRTVFGEMDENKVDDPALKAAVKLAKANIDKKVKERDTLNQFSIGSMSQNGWKNPLDASRYPIFDVYDFERYSSSTTKREHWYLYLNAAFKAATP